VVDVGDVAVLITTRSIAVALNPPPITRAEAQNVLARFPWAKPTPVIVSFPSHHDRREVVLADT
jgi:hypothetical protein